MVNQSIRAAFERLWQHIVIALSNKADESHNHNDLYYTKAEIDANNDNNKGSSIQLIRWGEND